MNINSHRDLIVWQKSIDLCIKVYDYSSDFPKEELFTLSQQMKRAAISIPSNIAEGRRRSSNQDYRHFLSMALGSTAELETQFEIAKRLKYGKNNKMGICINLLIECQKMLNTMITKLSP
jgi:four helix bundle protein